MKNNEQMKQMKQMKQYGYLDFDYNIGLFSELAWHTTFLIRDKRPGKDSLLWDLHNAIVDSLIELGNQCRYYEGCKQWIRIKQKVKSPKMPNDIRDSLQMALNYLADAVNNYRSNDYMDSDDRFVLHTANKAFGSITKASAKALDCAD